MRKKYALVTGGSQGIGKEIAISIAMKNIHVFVNFSRSVREAHEVVEEITRGGGSASSVQADVTDELAVQNMFKEISQHTNTLDYLVNNAGIDFPQPIETYDTSAWRRVLDVNLTGKYIVLKNSIPFLRNSDTPRIVNIASRLAWKPLEEASAYCCSEAAIIMMTKCAALELAPYGIKVNAVCPGFTRTPMTERIYKDESIWEQSAQNNPSKRVGHTKDIANAVMFLLADESNYINGTHILVEGGSSLI